MALVLACQIFVAFFGFLAWRTYSPSIANATGPLSIDDMSKSDCVKETSMSSVHGQEAGAVNMAFNPNKNAVVQEKIAA